jgi:hypothetical protein
MGRIFYHLIIRGDWGYVGHFLGFPLPNVTKDEFKKN